MKIAALLLAGATIMSAASHFDSLVDRYFDESFALQPSQATAAGFHHPYDAQLEDYSRAGIEKRIALSEKYLPLFEKEPQSGDRDWMISHLHAELVNLRDIRSWEKNPDDYSSGVTGSIFGLISRKFAPPEERLRDVIAREKQFPQVFAAARANLKNPPQIYTEVALEQLPGIQSFFANDVPDAFKDVTDRALFDEFKQTNQAAIDELKRYEQWVRADVLPRSHGDFRIGAENYHNKVKYEEMVDLPLDRLLQIGYDNLHENQRKLVALCKSIDPSKTPQQIAAKFEQDHPAPDQLLQTFRNTFSGLIDFINEHRIITVPSTIRPILEETPPFMRALTTASMDTPGPYEKVATEAFFNVTLPEKNWPHERVEEFMTAFNRGTIESTAIHEAYPGHYVQLLWFQKVQSKVRKLIQSNSNVEGWAHYCEQMMIDQGYGKDDPELKVGQLLDALLRNCRYIVGIEMHTGKRSYEQGIEFFMKEGYMSRDYSTRETKRGTSDPTYLVYTLGKLEIMKLRQDYRAKMGDRFSLEQFHNTFMQQGGVPIRLIRHAMLGNDSPVL
ncbi:MAG TPA: DUF885 domain-containing protein [Bryobacteraceae bacterium]|jgi:uncharacterized protein (DUF885 family)|nr:DUF885 domain-containing protein [Bryobacteraceae bacterium]